MIITLGALGGSATAKRTLKSDRKRREEISQHLSDRLIHDDNYFLGLLLQLGDTKKASRIVDLAHELREYLAEQMRHVAAKGTVLHRMLSCNCKTVSLVKIVTRRIFSKQCPANPNRGSLIVGVH